MDKISFTFLLLIVTTSTLSFNGSGTGSGGPGQHFEMQLLRGDMTEIVSGGFAVLGREDLDLSELIDREESYFFDEINFGHGSFRGEESDRFEVDSLGSRMIQERDVHYRHYIAKNLTIEGVGVVTIEELIGEETMDFRELVLRINFNYKILNYENIDGEIIKVGGRKIE